MQLDETEYSQLVGFRGDNGGYIILSISEKLHIAYLLNHQIRKFHINKQ